MVLSELAGAAQSLSGSLIINPWDTDMVAGALHEAVTMSDDLRRLSYERLWGYVSTRTSRWWGESFVQEIGSISRKAHMKLKVRRQLYLGEPEKEPGLPEGESLSVVVSESEDGESEAAGSPQTTKLLEGLIEK